VNFFLIVLQITKSSSIYIDTLKYKYKKYGIRTGDTLVCHKHKHLYYFTIIDDWLFLEIILRLGRKVENGLIVKFEHFPMITIHYNIIKLQY